MWTEQQKKAIETDNKNILVSAAAGSGKTAVLTERILQKLVTGEVSADRLVVVTFTKAAAAEMRERIRRGLEKRFKEEPDNKGLYVQMTLLADADICTMDSFCNKIVRTHFEEAGTDPDYRVAEEAEMLLIMSDVFSKAVEKYYEEGSEDFFEFASAFSSAKNDTDIEKIVYDVYDEAQNKPWPDEWLDECVRNSEASDLKDNAVLRIHLNRIKKRLKEYITGSRIALDRIYDGSGVEKYKPFMEEEIDFLEDILRIGDPYEIYRSVAAYTFKTFPTARGGDEELKKLCKGFRDAYKKYVTTIVPRIKDAETDGEDDYYLDGRISEKDRAYIQKSVKIIVDLTKLFSEMLEEEKKKRNLVTFADIEHMALNILVRRENGKRVETSTAKELKNFYYEILTDEYQDSNALQEEILEAIAAERNRYMVGDVKQSIYGFRGGDPGLFISKYERYSSDVKDNARIILQNNFRSRPGVLNACNKMFSALIHKEYTGISYDESEWLVPSFDFEEYEGEGKSFSGENGRVSCEVIFASEDELRDNERVEGLRIAEIIKDYDRSGYKVYDTKQKRYRPLCYRDIVVLVRDVQYGSGIAEALTAAGIPAYAEKKSVYTDTYEIRPVMSYLRVIDNPLDDVSFTALMMSYFGGFTADEIAILRTKCEDDFFFKGLIRLLGDCNEGPDEPPIKEKAEIDGSFPDRSIVRKTRDFLQKLQDLRKASASLSVYDLLWNIIYETGYYSYIGTVPAHESRLANLDLLLNRAFMFTGTSYNGLFQFLRYMERLEETKKDVGEISSVSELQNVVRVMTMHKSKGLEFPVVFLAGMEKKINFKDCTDKKKIVISDDYIATDVYDTERRVKRKTAFKKSLQAGLRQKTISEEIRLLYVAFTRAVEKLYIIGMVSGDSLSDAAGSAFFYEATGSYGICDLDGASRLINLMLPVILKNDAGDLFEIKESFSDNISDSEITCENTDSSRTGLSDASEKIVDKYKNFIYPYEEEINAKPKVTVTELKRMSMESEEETALDYHEYAGATDIEDTYSSFSGFTSAPADTSLGRGTVYHKLLEHLDMDRCTCEGDVEKQIKSLVRSGVLDEKAISVIRTEEIAGLAASDIGKRAAAALRSHKGKREQQFMMGIEIEGRSEDLLVQGVMDLWFEEDDGLVVVDYKTDKVNRRGGAKVLKDRYSKQLELYAQALSRAKNKPVKECVIYSFCLGKGINV